MRLNKLIYTLPVVALLMSTTSCKDFLDEMPDTRVELNSVNKARMLLADSYPSTNPGIIGELTSDNMEDNNTQDADGNRFNLGSYSSVDDELFAFEDVKTGSGSDTPQGVWSGYYSSIAGANAVLECLEKLEADIAAGKQVEDADQLPAVKGEALLIRAFGHFMLTQVFCMPYRGAELSKTIQGIPYTTAPEKVVKPHYNRNTLAEVYDFIQKDIEEGLKLIDNSIYTVPKYHFNLQAANAFAARFYLNKRDYKKVLQHCNRAFGGENAATSQYMSNLWASVGDYFYISDMARAYASQDLPRNFMLIPTYSQGFRHYVGSQRYAVNREAKRATIQGPGPTWEGFRYRNPQTGENFSMHPAFNGFCGVNGKAQYGTYFAGSAGEQFEYTNKLAGIGYTHITRTEFTGEETLLMRAEAKLFLGDKQGAIEDLKTWELAHRDTPNATGMESYWKELDENAIRSFYELKDPRYGIVKPIHIDEVFPCEYSVTADILPVLQCIQHFRRIEFIHTGMRFFDLKRYGIEWSHKIGPLNRIETMSLWDLRRAVQVPAEVLTAGLEPNKRLPDEQNEVSSAIEVNVAVKN